MLPNFCIMRTRAGAIKTTLNRTVQRTVSCGVCTTNITCNEEREARFMKKLMTTGNRKLKKYWYKGYDLPFEAKPAFSSAFGQRKGSSNHRRVSVLNSVFFQQITSMLSTGEIGNELAGYGIEISKVKVAADINVVNVYWLATGTDRDDVVEEMLKNMAFKLRHELTQLKVIGLVPPIQFVKDKNYASVAEVQRLLAVADFGEDFVPTEFGHDLKSRDLSSKGLDPAKTPNMYTCGTDSFSMKVKEVVDYCFPWIYTHVSSGKLTCQAINLETLEDTTKSSETEDWPMMRTDVSGLNHGAIMTQILKSIKKSKAVHRESPREAALVPEADSREVSVSSSGSRMKDFAKFLRQQKTARLKAARKEKNVLAEADVNTHEAEERRQRRLTLMGFEDEDFDVEEGYVDEGFYEER